MSDNVTNIDQHLVGLIEDLLRRVKQGEVRDVAVAGVFVNGSTFNCFSTAKNVMTLLGEIECLKYDFINECVTKRG